MSLKSRRKWILPEKKVEDIIEHIIQIRGIEDRESFLHPSLDNIYSWEKINDVNSAISKISEHIEKGSKILIHGDYDADGICATALLWEFLYRDLSKHISKKIDVVPYIPNRIEQGYGLTKDSLEDVVSLGANLVITVDCGIRDKDIIAEFKDRLDFVVTDHHQPPDGVFDDLDYPILHQMFQEKEYPFKEICGTSVAYLLVQGLREHFNMEVNPLYGLDLVALTTITDIMPLRDVNRVFVKYGLEEIRKGERLGFRMLSLRAGLDPEDIDVYHLGYVIGPRINAVGRIASPMDAVRLLVSRREEQCKEIANLLENTNWERQKMTEDILQQARDSISNVSSNLLFVLGEDWHEGIIGLVAGKLQEEFYKPVIIATKNNNIIKGSARSIKGFHITKALESHSKYLERYGGHELAAGFTAKLDSIDEFVESITDYAERNIREEDLIPELKVELLLDSNDITSELVAELKGLEPLGYGNPKPYVCLTNLEVKRKQIMGKDQSHMKIYVKGSGSDYLSLLLFNCKEDIDEITDGSRIDVVGYPDINVWNGVESVQFNVKEWRSVN